MPNTVLVVVALALMASGAAPAKKPATLRLTSTSFGQMGEIPSRHTCDGGDHSPPLAWSGAPRGTKSFALIVSDPDAPDPAAPKMTWTHWVLFALPTATNDLVENIRALPAGARQGINDWKQTGYRGPCPPIGSHRYFFRLYALDTTFPGLQRPTRIALERAMRGHVLAGAELIGISRKR